MQRTKIKICGITNEEDAFKLSQMAVDALGFIVTERDFPFKITAKKSARIIAQLPPFITSVVGVSLEHNSLKEIFDILKETAPDAVQVQLGGTLEEVKRIRGKFPKLKIIKTFFINRKEDLKGIGQYTKIIDMIFLHGERDEAITSKEEHLKTARKIVRGFSKPVMIAGGLEPTNVAQVIGRVRPYAIDLISGVEKIPGKKDFAKVEKLIEVVHGADKKTYSF